MMKARSIPSKYWPAVARHAAERMWRDTMSQLGVLQPNLLACGTLVRARPRSWQDKRSPWRDRMVPGKILSVAPNCTHGYAVLLPDDHILLSFRVVAALRIWSRYHPRIGSAIFLLDVYGESLPLSYDGLRQVMFFRLLGCHLEGGVLAWLFTFAGRASVPISICATTRSRSCRRSTRGAAAQVAGDTQVAGAARLQLLNRSQVPPRRLQLLHMSQVPRRSQLPRRSQVPPSRLQSPHRSQVPRRLQPPDRSQVPRRSQLPHKSQVPRRLQTPHRSQAGCGRTHPSKQVAYAAQVAGTVACCRSTSASVFISICALRSRCCHTGSRCCRRSTSASVFFSICVLRSKSYQSMSRAHSLREAIGQVPGSSDPFGRVVEVNHLQLGAESNRPVVEESVPEVGLQFAEVVRSSGHVLCKHGDGVNGPEEGRPQCHLRDKLCE